jgi:hypothetical protein
MVPLEFGSNVILELEGVRVKLPVGGVGVYIDSEGTELTVKYPIL